MLDRFKENIEKKVLFEQNDKILLAVSGGLDSVVMAELFHACGYQFAIAHCNFRLRGSESDQDAEFVKNLSSKLACQYFEKIFDTQEYANSLGISTQMAARKLRYAWFEEVRSKNGWRYIATAHHNNDHTETILINLIRGTGLAGLQGIKARRSNLVRPLLHFSRNEINAFAESKNLAYREDSSNVETKYIRNKIRHELIPLLEEINPSVNDALGRLAKISEDTTCFLKHFIFNIAAEHTFRESNKYYINFRAISQYPAVELILYELLKGFGFQSAVVSEIIKSMDSQPGKRFYSATHVCLKDRKFLVVSSLKSNNENHQAILVQKDEKELRAGSGKFTFKYHYDFTLRDLSGDPFRAFIDLEKLHFPLKLRHPVDGDMFYPFGMSGRKKLSDYLTDKKIPFTEKQNVWLLCSDEKIVWVVGMRSDERFRVPPTTKKVLEIIYTPFYN